jgi:hypothetical protein
MNNNKLSAKDLVHLVGRFRIKKFTSQADFEAGNAYDEHQIGENLLLNEGINELFTILCSTSSGTKFDNTNAYIGVGDSDTAAAATQTDLQATVNKLYVAMDAGFPTFGTDEEAVFQSTFGASDANFAWKEFTVANGSSGTAKNLDRLVQNEGTKTSGQIWQLSLTIGLS